MGLSSLTRLFFHIMRLPRSLRNLAAFLVAIVVLTLPGPAQAQYMYLDSNGDGLNTAADTLNVTGVPTAVDVWLITNQRADGSAATCVTEDGPMDLNSYVVNLRATGGTVSFSGYANYPPSMATAFYSPLSNSTEFAVGRGGATILPPGKYKLFRITITGASGSPSIDIVPRNTFLIPDGTSYGTTCSGNDFDNMYKLFDSTMDYGDWTDVAGVGRNRRIPTIATVAEVSGAENQPLTIAATATDLDAGDLLTMSLGVVPRFLTFTHVPSVAPAVATLSGTPGYSDAGTYTLTWHVTDGLRGSSATTTLSVANTDRPPVIQAPDTVLVSAPRTATFLVTAFDPDNQRVNLAVTPSLLGARLDDWGSGYWRFTWTAASGQIGDHLVTFAPNPTGTPRASTLIRVLDGQSPPVLAAPLYAKTTDSALLAFDVLASDPDGESIGQLSARDLPAAAAFTVEGQGTIGHFAWTTTPGDVGRHSVTFVATNTLQGIASTLVDVTPDRPPVIAIQGSPSGREGAPIHFSIAASDPDSTPLTAFSVLGTPPGASFVTGPNSVSGTFSWTPGYADAGKYPLRVTASNRLVTTTTYNVTVQNVDRPPVLSAPDSITVPTGERIVFDLIALDPDGEPIITWTAQGLPLGSSFTNGHFDWTPESGQEGFYIVTFGASNTMASSAVTVITVEYDFAPVITVPLRIAGAEGQELRFGIDASDPDGDLLSGLSVTGVPAGAAIMGSTPSGGGAFVWTPLYGQSGTYRAVFTATNRLSASAVTLIDVAMVDTPPVIMAPSEVRGLEGQAVHFDVLVSDPEADVLLALEARDLPPGATFSAGPSYGAGSFFWVPAEGQRGLFPVSIAATSASRAQTVSAPAVLTTMAVVNVVVGTSDQAPQVTAPSAVYGTEGQPTTFQVLIVDPDGDAISDLSAAPLPPGAEFTATPDNTSAAFCWTPDYFQAGEYALLVTGGNSLTCSAPISISIANADRPPTLSAPAAQTVDEGASLQFSITASDPDGESLAALTASGLPSGAQFQVAPDAGSATFSWAPTYSQSGDYLVTILAASALQTTASVPIHVNEVNALPILHAPATTAVDEGAQLRLEVTGSDPDGSHVSIGTTGIPLGAFFTDTGQSMGLFDWSPSFVQAGTYELEFTGHDDAGGAAPPARSIVTVADANRAPIAIVGGPYTGVVNAPVAFDGSQSYDPDGATLSYAWSFGDGALGSGASLQHAYTTGGIFTVGLSVSDGSFASSAATSVTIQDILPATAFTTGGYSTIYLGSSRATWCAQIEPSSAGYFTSSVATSSISMSYGPGRIFAQSNKSSTGGDANANGVQELTACFAKSDLRILLGSLPKGKNAVNVLIEGGLVTGGIFRAPLQVVVASTGATLSASLAPNPLNPDGTLTFTTTRPGRARVRLYDLQGRLVRRVLDDGGLEAGYHDVRIDGRGENASPLPSGIYFYRIEATEGEVTGRFTVTR